MSISIYFKEKKRELIKNHARNSTINNIKRTMAKNYHFLFYSISKKCQLFFSFKFWISIFFRLR